MREYMQFYVRNIRKKNLRSFVSTIKVSILVSLLLLSIYYISNNTIDKDYITNEYPEYPKFNSDINHEGKISNGFYVTNYPDS